MLHSIPARLLTACILLCACFTAAGCGGGSDTTDVSPEDVDATTPVEITDDERAAFDAPADSVLTEAQVESYLKTSLLQFDLIRSHSETLHERAAKMKQRDEEGGTIAGLRNLMDAGRTAMEFGNVIGGSFIRSARTLGYNPAEVAWVRERMAETAAYLAYAPVQEGMLQGARDMRAKLEAMQEKDSGTFSREELDAALGQIDDVEQSARREAPGAVGRNVRVLRDARPNVTDDMWVAVGLSAGSMGLMSLSGLADPDDQEAQEQLDEFRALYTDALENRVTPGMEAE